MCKIQEKRPNQNLSIILEVHEGKVEGHYSIEGTAQMPGFSFVVRVTSVMQLKQFFNEMMYQYILNMIFICV